MFIDHKLRTAVMFIETSCIKYYPELRGSGLFVENVHTKTWEPHPGDLFVPSHFELSVLAP